MYNENYDYDSQGNLWKKGIVGSETVYTYLDGNHKHAVTHLGGAPMYGYDLNGNMTSRKVGAITYTQGWDAENRLVSVSGTGVSASFGYDGDGVRVKGTVNGTVTAYVGNWFEWTGSTSTMKKYYYAGSQRIAMRTGSGTGTSGLLWMIGDHLGSTTKIANADGTINSQRRYRPWGEARYGGTMPTTFAFTGQRQEVQLGGTDGLYYYGARWYDAALGRWLSPDSIIPEAAQGVQAWSRYTYVNNAPTRYRDPTGHGVDGGPPYRPTPTPKPPTPDLLGPPRPVPYQIGPAPTREPFQIGPAPTATPTPKPTSTPRPIEIDLEATFDYITAPDFSGANWYDILPGPMVINDPFHGGAPVVIDLHSYFQAIDTMLTAAYTAKEFGKDAVNFLSHALSGYTPGVTPTPSMLTPTPGIGSYTAPTPYPTITVTPHP